MTTFIDNAVCEFVRQQIGVDIYPAQDRQSQIQVVDTQQQAADLFSQNATIKLFFREHYLYGCHAQTWGASKGQDLLSSMQS